MPVLVSNGKQYRMPLLPGNVRERPAYAVRNVHADRYEDLPITRPRRQRAYPAMRSALGATRRPLNSYHHSMAVIPSTTQGCLRWSSEDDKALRQLKASNVSWKRISTVMDGRPIAELKERWLDIRDGRHRVHEAYDLNDLYENDDDDWYFEEDYDEDYGRESRHVSFSPSLDEETDDSDYVPSKRSRTKKVYYLDDEFTLDEVLLLHRIAADWERDRLETICSRFNSKTGRHITRRQARSVLDE
ncbi:uncharacterized protein DSM5745_06500 [Aspergillus mulundensis]|uniref:Myb-like domain-containing protein n=1 Tax=Aspergillus mulundensis TaxID=1810919 RepID=A0A3D8RRD3_9EURO|nr:Uncharacterized protein DSM5745_06500 [Aspergillus mulundensis]RDW76508.1 Uncharacterized protein DSM5745_06500 [Aspergillus mulundensis]